MISTKSPLAKKAAAIHRISAKITPISKAKACLGPREKLVSMRRKNMGPMKTRLNIIPKPSAEKISSNINTFGFYLSKYKPSLKIGYNRILFIYFSLIILSILEAFSIKSFGYIGFASSQLKISSLLLSFLICFFIVVLHKI